MKIYKSLKNVDGSYSHLDFIRRGLQLVGLREFNKFYKNYHNSINREGKLPILVDYYFCLLRYGATVCDYFEYRFWEKKNCLRKSYITMWMSRKIQKTFNHGSTEICTNKKMFNEKFSKFHNIKDFYYSSNSTEKEFLDFVIACNRKIIAKPITGFSGLGIQIPQWDKIKHLVKEAALVCPQIGHMAWDIAVSNDKICFIEVNEQGNFDVPQTASQRGYKKDYIEIIKRMHKNGNEEGN